MKNKSKTISRKRKSRHVFTLEVAGPPSMSPSRALELVRRLIASGQEDAALSERDSDLDDMDAKEAASLSVAVSAETSGRDTIDTVFVQTVTVKDPNSGLPVEVEIRKTSAGAMVGIDGSWLSEDVGPTYSPYDRDVEMVIPDDE